MDANLTFLYRSSAARSFSLSKASGQLVHLVVQKSVVCVVWLDNTKVLEKLDT